MDAGAIVGLVLVLFFLISWLQSWPKACYLCAGLATPMCGCLEVSAACGRCIGIYMASTVTHLTLFPLIAGGSMVSCLIESMVWRIRLLFTNACSSSLPVPPPPPRENNNNPNPLIDPVPEPRPWFIAYPERNPGYFIPSDSCLPPCCLSPSVYRWSHAWIDCIRNQSERCGYDRESGFHKCTFPNSNSCVHILCILPTLSLYFVFGQGLAQFIGMGYAAVYFLVLFFAIPFGFVVFYFQIPYFRGTLYRIVPSKTEKYVRYTGSYLIDILMGLLFIPLVSLALGFTGFLIEFPLTILKFYFLTNPRRGNDGPFRNHDNTNTNNNQGQITWVSLLRYSPVSRTLFATIIRMMDVILQGYQGRRYRSQESSFLFLRNAFTLIQQATVPLIQDECAANNAVPNEPMFLPRSNHTNHNDECTIDPSPNYPTDGSTVIRIMNPVRPSSFPSSASFDAQYPDGMPPVPTAPDYHSTLYPDGLPPSTSIIPPVPVISLSTRFGRCPVCADTILYPSVTVRLCNGDHTVCLLCAARSLRLMLDEGRLSTIGKMHKVLQCPLYMSSSEEDFTEGSGNGDGGKESLPSGKILRKPCTVSLETVELVYRRSHIALNNPSSPKFVDNDLSYDDIEFLQHSLEFRNEGENRPLADTERRRFIDLAVISAAAKAREIQLTLQKNTTISSTTTTASPFAALLQASKDFQLDGDVIFNCPHPSCGRLTSARSATVDPLPDRVPSLAYTETTASVKCIHCHGLSCRLCRVPWTAAHVGQTCTSVQRLRRMHSVAHNALFDSLGITFKQCPGCGTGITHYRGHGCHHIRPGSGCTNCGTHFCYVCLYKFPSNGPFSCPFDCPKFCTMDGVCGCLDCPDCKPGQPCTECDACRSSNTLDRCTPGKPCSICQREKICRSCVRETSEEKEERLAKQELLHDKFIKTINNNRNTNNPSTNNNNNNPTPVNNNNNNNVRVPLPDTSWPWQVLPPVHQRTQGWEGYRCALGEIDIKIPGIRE